MMFRLTRKAYLSSKAMNSTRNMTIRDIPQELLRNAEKRRKQRQRQELGAACIDGVFYVAGLAVYCSILKAFIR